MASKKFTIILAGDSKGASKAMGDAGQSADNLSIGLDKNSAFAAGAFAAIGAGAVTLAADVAQAFGRMVVDSGEALVDLGNQFHDAYANIRVGTGATGAALDGLEGSFRNVAETVPSDMGEVSTAIGDLNTRLGITGKPLEDLATQVLYLSDLTGTDLSKAIM